MMTKRAVTKKKVINLLGFVYGEIYKESRRIICEEEFNE